MENEVNSSAVNNVQPECLQIMAKHTLISQEMVTLNHLDSYWLNSPHSDDFLRGIFKCYKYNNNAHTTGYPNEQVTEISINTHVKKKGNGKVQKFLKWLPTIGRMTLGCTT